MVELLFLGTGASMVTAKRACPGILLGGRRLLDCGFGVLVNLRRAGVSLDDIGELYISHTHADHIGDFTGLLWAMQLEGRRRPLRVISSGGAAAALERIAKAQSTPEGFIKFPLSFVRPKDAGVEASRSEHAPENLAYRVTQDGIDVVYTGDTAYSPAVARLSKGTHVLIHDCTFLDSQRDEALSSGHSTAGDAARTANEAGVDRLIMIHISPLNEEKEEEYLEEARRIFSGRVTVARDLMRLDV